MQVRHTHLLPGPQLETSIPKTHPDHAIRMEALSIYAANLYAKLLAYGEASFSPTQDGAYRDLFSYDSPSRTTNTYVHGTPTPDQIANQAFNLVIKIREHEGLLFLVVAPTANADERTTLKTALADIQADWRALYGLRGGEARPAAIVYHWLSDDDQPRPDLWPDTVIRSQAETDIFHAPPQQ